MFSTWPKHSNRILVTALLGTSYLYGSATAWQFRDLDSTAPSPSNEATAQVLDLIPTDQEFIAPLVDAPKKQQLDLAPPQPPKTVLKPATPVAKLEPKTPELAKPVPIPMPELNVVEKAHLEPVKPSKPIEKPAVEELDPIEVFKQGLENSESHPDVYSAKFKDVQAGTTSTTDLVEAWGEPTRIISNDDESQTYIYHVPSFKQVEVAANSGVVSGVLVHLRESIVASQVAKELGVDDLAGVPVPDEYGEVLGLAYPERGILFSFTEGSDAARVSAILLEPISAEMFRLRAQYDFGHHYSRSLADLDNAISLDPMDAESYWLRAEYLDIVGRTREAVKSIQKAVRLKPTNSIFRITRSRLYAKTNRLQSAIEELEAVISEVEMPNEVAGRAHDLLGDLLAIGTNANHQDALRNHLKAIEYASISADDRRFAVRRMAKQTLVTAHMSVARDIAMGNFQRQSEVVPKWLLRATEVADEFISDDQGDELLQLQIFRDTLASYSELHISSFDAAMASEEALKAGREMIAEATDEQYKITVERMLAETLLHASKIHRTRGKHDLALKLANNALALLENSQAKWENTTHDEYLQAELSFVVGSIYAIRDQNHLEAMEWYARARSGFVGSNFVTPLYSQRSHGEMYVSMGLSFWEGGEQEKAVQLTKKGAELMKEAVETGSLQLVAMAVPYGNLATMHGKLGHGDKSQEYAKLVAKLETAAKTNRY